MRPDEDQIGPDVIGEAADLGVRRARQQNGANLRRRVEVRAQALRGALELRPGVLDARQVVIDARVAAAPRTPSARRRGPNGLGSRDPPGTWSRERAPRWRYPERNRSRSRSDGGVWSFGVPERAHAVGVASTLPTRMASGAGRVRAGIPAAGNARGTSPETGILRRGIESVRDVRFELAGRFVPHDDQARHAGHAVHAVARQQRPARADHHLAHRDRSPRSARADRRRLSISDRSGGTSSAPRRSRCRRGRSAGAASLAAGSWRRCSARDGVASLTSNPRRSTDSR